jgi:hypothetical protein
MKSTALAYERDDRESTREELNLAVDLMADLHEVPFEAAFEFVERSFTLSNLNDLGLWTDANGIDRPSSGIETLAGIIIGRRDRSN